MPIHISGTVSAAGENLAGILVSNGEEVVATDQQGRYGLAAELDHHSFIWVCVPAGMRAKGSFFRPLPAADTQIDFALEKAPERRATSFRFAQITDIHLVEETDLLTQADVLRHHLQSLVGQEAPAFIAASGDLTNRGFIGELASCREILRQAGAPLFPLFGNHDGGEERRSGRRDTAFIRHYEQHFGPVCYSFDWGCCHFVFFADMDPLFSAEAQRRKLAWLWADLEAQPAGKPTILVKHAHTDPALIEQLAGRGVKLILWGHWHSSKVFRLADVLSAATPSFCFGGIDTNPRGYRLIQVDGVDIAVEYRASQAANLRPQHPEKLDGMALRWMVDVGGDLHRCAPVFQAGKLFVGRRDEDGGQGGGVLCLDAATGQTVWKSRTDSSVKNAPAVDVQAGICLAASVAGELYAFELGSGRVRWQRELVGYPERWIYTQPLSAAGVGYTASQWGAQAHRLEDGGELWYTPLGERDWVPCYASPLLTDELLIALVQGRGLVALDRQRGTIVWEAEFRAGYQYGRPVCVGARLFTTGETDCLLALEAGTGEKIWEVEGLGEYASGLAADGERIYAATPVGELRCFSQADGALQWTFSSGPDLLDATPYRRGIHSLLAAPVLWGDKLWVGGNDGVLYVLEKDGGPPVEQAAFGAPLTAPPCPSAAGLCISTWDGRLLYYA